MKRIILVSLAAILVFTGCSTTTVFESDPPGAKAYLDGELIGETPVEIKLSNFIGNPYVLELKKEGYKPFKTAISKEAKAGPIIAGACTGLLPIFLWCYGPKEKYSYELESNTSLMSTLIIEKHEDYRYFIDNMEIKESKSLVEPGQYSIRIVEKNREMVSIKMNFEADYTYKLSDIM